MNINSVVIKCCAIKMGCLIYGYFSLVWKRGHLKDD